MAAGCGRTTDMRFLAPSRAAVAADTFNHPVFSALSSWHDLLSGAEWPGVAGLDERLAPLQHAGTGHRLRLVPQEALAQDGHHYETRIRDRGEIATRAENWHDLFNALAWKRMPAVKSALNARQVSDIARIGTRQRTRAQDALTQFDEAGAIVVVRDAEVLRAWDAHDWPGLFLDQREAWRDGRITLAIVGHAIHEHALDRAMWLVTKTLVFDASTAGKSTLPADDAAIDARAGQAIASSACLEDPLELRPLPVSGIPGWRAAVQDAAFYRDAPCFRPRREGRSYPPPMPWHA